MVKHWLTPEEMRKNAKRKERNMYVGIFLGVVLFTYVLSYVLYTI